jgi:hypothetical protein
METNLDKAKRLTKAHAAIQGVELKEDNYFFEMLELAAQNDIEYNSENQNKKHTKCIGCNKQFADELNKKLFCMCFCK